MYEHHDELHEPVDEVDAADVEQIRAGRHISEQDLAMYAAITGRRPVVEIVRDRPPMTIAEAVTEGPKGIKSIFSSARNHQKVSVWIRTMSINARRKVGEAAMRLAS